MSPHEKIGKVYILVNKKIHRLLHLLDRHPWQIEQAGRQDRVIISTGTREYQ